MRLYSAVVWTSLCEVLILSTVSIWWLGRRPQHPLRLRRFLHEVWALALGVSFPQLPRDSRLRALLALLLWYFLGISSIFQTLFTSMLVDLGLKKQITTSEELQQSGLKYCIHLDMEHFINASGPYLADIKHPKVKSGDMNQCMTCVPLSDDMATITSAYVI
jgi:hypothetical protein